MKHNILSFFALAGILLSPSALAHDEVKTYNLSNTQLERIETVLETFFNKVESYSENRQNDIYATLNERIAAIIERYESGTPNRAILDILDLSVEHLAEENKTGGVSDILQHVIYGKQYHRVEEVVRPTQPVVTEDITSSDNASDVQQEEEKDNRVYRADLDTEDLNEFDKDVLAGVPVGVMSQRVISNREAIDTERVEIRFNQDMEDIGLTGNLYYNGYLVGRASTSDVDDNTMIFDNMTDLIVGETTGLLSVELIAGIIGEDELGEARAGITITRISLQENKGTISTRDVGDQTYRETSRVFNIVPAVLTLEVEAEFEKNRSIAALRIHADAGDNNNDGNGFSPELTNIRLQISSFESAGEITVFNGNGSTIGSATITGAGNIDIALEADSISSRGERYEIITSAEAIFRLPQDGLTYTAGNESFTSSLGKQILIGER